MRNLSRKLFTPKVLTVCLGASVLLNGVFVGWWIYLANFNPVPLQQIAVARLCSEPGYSHRMQDLAAKNRNNAEQVKRFAAAATCFVDYNTGKTLDLGSLQPQSDTDSILPAHP